MPSVTAGALFSYDMSRSAPRRTEQKTPRSVPLRQWCTTWCPRLLLPRVLWRALLSFLSRPAFGWFLGAVDESGPRHQPSKQRARRPPGATASFGWSQVSSHPVKTQAFPDHTPSLPEVVVKSIPPNTENWLRKLYDKNYNNDTSTEDKHETNYSMNNGTRNMHIT